MTDEQDTPQVEGKVPADEPATAAAPAAPEASAPTPGAPTQTSAAPAAAPVQAGPGGRPPFRKKREFRGKYVPRRKVCAFCADKSFVADYKDVARLRRFLSDRGKIEPRRKTGTCAGHQRTLTTALKRARFIALLPYTAEHIRVMGGPPLGRGA